MYIVDFASVTLDRCRGEQSASVTLDPIRDRCRGGQSANRTFDREITCIAAFKKCMATNVLRSAWWFYV